MSLVFNVLHSLLTQKYLTILKSLDMDKHLSLFSHFDSNVTYEFSANLAVLTTSQKYLQ